MFWTRHDAARATEQARTWLAEKLEEREGKSTVPKYPIMLYALGDSLRPTATSAVAAAAEVRTQTPQSYDDGLALNNFVREFVRMLQRGLRVVRHSEAPAPARACVLTLSADCKSVWWEPRESPPHTPPRQHRVREMSSDFESAPASHLCALAVERRAACFALKFQQLGASEPSQDPLVPEIAVFETANAQTKKLLVDGFRLLVEQAVASYFTSQEFRIASVL